MECRRMQSFLCIYGSGINSLQEAWRRASPDFAGKSSLTTETQSHREITVTNLNSAAPHIARNAFFVFALCVSASLWLTYCSKASTMS
jgi:hypothetical protein